MPGSRLSISVVDVARLIYVDGLPVDVAAARLGCSISTIKNRLEEERYRLALESRKERLRAAWERRHWCPPEFRPLYRTMVKKVGAAEARLIVERDLIRPRVPAAKHVAHEPSQPQPTVSSAHSLRSLRFDEQSNTGGFACDAKPLCRTTP
jgi:hypothetical protein